MPQKINIHLGFKWFTSQDSQGMVVGVSIAVGIVVAVVATTLLVFFVKKNQTNAQKNMKSEKGNYLKE